MNLTFRSLDGDGPSTAVESPGGALRMLDWMLPKGRVFCVFESPYHDLLVGIGARGCAQHSGSGRKPPYMMATVPDAIDDRTPCSFVTGGTPTEIPARYCIPWGLVRSIVAYFAAHDGGRDPHVDWEEI